MNCFGCDLFSEPQKLSREFCPDDLEALREQMVKCYRPMRTVSEISEISKRRKLRVCDVMIQGPFKLPDHLATRQLQWQQMLTEYENRIKSAEFQTDLHEFRDGTLKYEPWSEEKIDQYKAKCRVMIEAIKKKIDEEILDVSCEHDAEIGLVDP